MRKRLILGRSRLTFDRFDEAQRMIRDDDGTLVVMFGLAWMFARALLLRAAVRPPADPAASSQ